MTDVAAHDQTETIHLLRHYAAHHARKGDPLYPLFEQAKRQIKRQGLWKCAIAVLQPGDCAGPLSLHHASIEFAYGPEADPDKVNELLGLHLTPPEFARWIEEPGNLEVLCRAHHMPGKRFAVHSIPHADWTIIRVHAAGMVPVEVVPA